jgi:hypothetical protein
MIDWDTGAQVTPSVRLKHRLWLWQRQRSSDPQAKRLRRAQYLLETGRMAQLEAENLQSEVALITLKESRS